MEPRRFITAFTSARQLSLSWASSFQSIPPHSTSRRFILILISHLRLGLPSGLFPSSFPHQNPVYDSALLHTRYMPRLYHSSRVYHPNNIGWGVQIIKLLFTVLFFISKNAHKCTCAEKKTSCNSEVHRRLQNCGLPACSVLHVTHLAPRIW